jgi:hypothetical protein
MSSNETIFSFLSENKALLKDYLDTRLDLIKLQGVRSLSRTISLVMVTFIISLLLLSILLLLTITFAFWIASITDSNIIGFGSATGLLIIILIGFIAFGREIVQNLIIRRIIQDSMDEPEDIDN